MTRGLGKAWAMSDNSYKPYACGVVIHPAIDGCVQLRNEHKLKLADIARIDLKVHPLVVELCSRRDPKSRLEGKFSIFHSCAAAILLGEGGVREALVHFHVFELQRGGVVAAGNSGVEGVVVAMICAAGATTGHCQCVVVASGTVVECVVASAQHGDGCCVIVASLVNGYQILVASKFGIGGRTAYIVARSNLIDGDLGIATRLIEIYLVIGCKQLTHQKYKSKC